MRDDLRARRLGTAVRIDGVGSTGFDLLEARNKIGIPRCHRRVDVQVQLRVRLRA
jgi:hypothetical protein